MASNTVTDQSSLHRYRTEIPNIVLEMGLSVYALRLYLQLKKVAGDEGGCWQSTRTLARDCQMSVSKISESKIELVSAKLVDIEKRDGNQTDLITVVDIWPQNFERYASSQKSAKSAGRNSSARQHGGVPSGAKPAPRFEESTATPPTNSVTALQSAPSRKEEAVQSAEEPALPSTISSLSPMAADQGFTTSDSSATTAMIDTMPQADECSPNEQGVRHANKAFAVKTQCSPDEQGVRHSATNKNQLRKTPEEEEGEGASAQTTHTPFDAELEPEPDDEVNFWEDGPAQPKPPEPGESLHMAICEVLGWDFKTLPRKRRTELMHASETLSRAGYLVEDVRRFMPVVWFVDWRWEIKHSRPNLDQFMEEIGKLRASTPEPVPRKAPAKLSDAERAAIVTRAKQAMNSIKTAQKFKGKIDPSWQLDIDRARELNLI